MIIGVVFMNGEEIDRGICTAGKKWTKNYPEQSITITKNTSCGSEIKYIHDGEITFQELQDNGNGWEIVYDSNEKIDRTVEYSLPGWFTHGGPIPDYEHKINKEGTINSEFKGWIK
jgi:hypothetical protein